MQCANTSKKRAGAPLPARPCRWDSPATLCGGAECEQLSGKVLWENTGGGGTACPRAACDTPACARPACPRPACNMPACNRPACGRHGLPQACLQHPPAGPRPVCRPHKPGAVSALQGRPASCMAGVHAARLSLLCKPVPRGPAVAQSVSVLPGCYSSPVSVPPS
eukprot:365323-Chlamydomonas_euryale.AAC.20